MKDKLVSFETSKLAKEKGFDEPCYDCYNPHGMQFSNGWCEYIHDNDIEIPFDNECIKEKDILAPTQSLLQKWLRENYNLHIDIYRVSTNYRVNIECMSLGNSLWSNDIDYKTYEKALEEGLLSALKLIKK